MDLKTVLVNAFILAVFGVYAWLNPESLTYSFALLVISAFLLVNGFIKSEALVDFLKARFGSGNPTTKPDETKPKE